MSKSKLDTISTREWSIIIGGTRPLGRRLLAEGMWIFEWVKTHKQVGDCCGQITDPHGRDVTCNWADGVMESIPRNLVRIAPSPGDTFGDYTLVRYTANGVEVALKTEGLLCTPAKRRQEINVCFCTPGAKQTTTLTKDKDKGKPTAAKQQQKTLAKDKDKGKPTAAKQQKKTLTKDKDKGKPTAAKQQKTTLTKDKDKGKPTAAKDKGKPTAAKQHTLLQKIYDKVALKKSQLLQKEIDQLLKNPDHVDTPGGDTNYVRCVALRIKRNHEVMIAYGLLQRTPTASPAKSVEDTTPTPTASSAKSVENTTPTPTASPAKSVEDSDEDYVPTPTASPAKSVENTTPTPTASSAKSVENTTPTPTASSAKSVENTMPTPTASPAKVEDSDEDYVKPSSDDDDVTPQKLIHRQQVTWRNCKLAALPERAVELLREYMSDNDGTHNHYVFAHRVCKRYAWLQKNKPDALHCNREKHINEAVTHVFKDVALEGYCPYDRDVVRAVNAVGPAVEAAFEMPGASMKVGSKPWIDELLRNPQTIPLYHASKYPTLEKHLINFFISNGRKGPPASKAGYPKRNAGAPSYLRAPYLRASYLRAPYLRAPYLRASYLRAPYLRAPYLRASYFRASYLRAPYLCAPYLRASYLHAIYSRASYLLCARATIVL